MAALVAALLAHATDRTGWTAAMLADRWHRPGAVIAAAVLVIAALNALAAIAGSLLAPRMTPNAGALLLAVALLLAGVGALWPGKPPKSYAAGGGGAFLSSLMGFFALAFSDRTAFVTLALAVRTPIPALPAIGAAIGGIAVVSGYAIAGERGRRQAPLLAIRVFTGIVFILAGVISALSALRLI